MTCAATVLLAGLGSLALTANGWREHGSALDMLRYYLGVEDLLVHGNVPVAGTLTSFASFAPPGITWLLLPGALTMPDPRLYEYPGAWLLLLGTLLGIYLVAQAFFGSRTAVLAVGMYAFSELGLYLAWSLWPRGHPFFAIWMVYWLQRWVVRQEGTALALALLTWAAGMYAFLEIAPAILIPVALWLVYRRPVRVRPLLIVGLVTLMIWWPYLHFEAGRGFVDLESQVFRRSMLPVNYRDAWCDPGITFERQGEVAPIDADWGVNWVGNFAWSARVPWAGPALAFLTALSVVAARRRSGPLSLIVFVAWAAMLAITEPGRPVRFWWLWPLQVVFLAAVPSTLARIRGTPHLTAPLVAIALVLTLALNPLLVSSVKRWLDSGWTDTETAEYQTIDFIAARVRSSGADHAAIGYEIDAEEFMAAYHIVDPNYKVGAGYDYPLRGRGVTNTDDCAEGVSMNDEYRIVEAVPSGWSPERFAVPPDSGFREVQQFGRFRVLVAE